MSASLSCLWFTMKAIKERPVKRYSTLSTRELLHWQACLWVSHLGHKKGFCQNSVFTGASSGTGFCRLRKSQIALRFTVVRERLWLKFCFARRFNNLPQITQKLPPNGHCGKLILSRNETAGYFTVISPVIFQFQMLLFFFQSQPTGWITISCESRKLLGKSLVKSWKKNHIFEKEEEIHQISNQENINTGMHILCFHFLSHTLPHPSTRSLSMGCPSAK